MTGAQVLQLQQYLMSRGLLTQKDIDTGPGVYGPKTTAAVAQLQNSLGVDSAGGVGFYGPKTIAAVQTGSAPANTLNFSGPSGVTGNNANQQNSFAASAAGGNVSAPAAAAANPPPAGGGTPPAQSVASLLASAADLTNKVKAELAAGTITDAQAKAELDQIQGGVSQLQNNGTFGGGNGPTGANSGTTSAPEAPAGSITGNDKLDTILKSVQNLLDTNKATIPPGLQITPQLTQQFLAWAHQAVDPQTKQLIDSEIANINASSANQQKQFEAQQGEVLQNFGTNLATEQNAAGASGTAFSGQRNLNERNLAATANRTLSSLASNTAYNIGAGLRNTAANVGSANAGAINIPSLTAMNVGIEGGSRGSTAPANSLDFSYNPGLYTAGVIPTNQNTAVNQLAGNYLGQYTTLAGTNSGRSMSDLIGGITGLPANYQIPSGLT